MSDMCQPVLLVRGSSDQQQAIETVALTLTYPVSIPGLAQGQQPIKMLQTNKQTNEKLASRGPPKYSGLENSRSSLLTARLMFVLTMRGAVLHLNPEKPSVVQGSDRTPNP